MTRIVQNLTVQLNVEAGPVKKLVDMLGEYREGNRGLPNYEELLSLANEMAGALDPHVVSKSPDANVERVRQLLLDRSVVGLKKYGVTTERTDLNLPQWLQHAIEEALDLANYLQAAKAYIERQRPVATIHVDGSFVHVEWHNAAPNEAHLQVYSEPSPNPDRLALATSLIQDFCSRVESGEVRSVRTYAKFKAFLDGVK